MPSPFPGMDPYLEDPVIFPDFHDRFISYLSEAIQVSLPDPYYAALGRRAWVEISERFIGPDVNLVAPGGSGRSSGDLGTASAAATIESGPIQVHVPHDEQVETLVEIYIGRGSERRLVTAIELLSPSNKTPGEMGRDLYKRKQQEVLYSKTHLIEIDLLRGGEHTTAVSQYRMGRRVPKCPYHVCLHRFDNVEDFWVYPIQLNQSLPSITVPLLPGDGEVSVDLQSVFKRTYDAGPYHREIDYRLPVPPPELEPEIKDWARELVEREFLRDEG